MNHPRPRPYFIPAERYETALDDPALGALAAEGWTVVSATTVARGKLGPNGEETIDLMLILWPPPRAIALVDAVASEARPLELPVAPIVAPVADRRAFVLLLMGLAVGCALGGLVVALALGLS